jgi:subtilisin family serine protease
VIRDEHELAEALGFCARREVLVVAAAGNQGVVGSSAITRHPWVISVVAYARAGRPLAQSNLGRSMGWGGLGAPGEGVVSLVPAGESAVSAGTSIAAPFVTGAAALLWSAFPDAAAVEVKHALLVSSGRSRRMVAPPLLDAWGAYQRLSQGQLRRAAP